MQVYLYDTDDDRRRRQRAKGGRGKHGTLATWASAQNALKVAIFKLKIEKIFWGGGNAPSPDPS